MKSPRGFVWLPVLLVILGVLAIGGGAYWYRVQSRVPAAASLPLLMFISPQPGAKVSAIKPLQVQWKFTDPSITQTFPIEHTFIALDLISSSGQTIGSIGDGTLLKGASEIWNIASNLNQRFYTLTPGAQYKIRATLQYNPYHTCDPVKSRKDDCWPVYSAADQALIDKAKQYQSESGWFTVDLTGYVLPVAIMDQNPATISPINLTLTGTATVGEIKLQILGKPKTYDIQVPVLNGKWSYAPSQTPLPDGSYTLNIWTADGVASIGGGTMTVSSPESEFKAVTGTTFTLTVGQGASDGPGGITVRPLSITSGQYPSVSVSVISASSTYEAALAETAKTWGLTPGLFGASAGSELNWSAKWAYHVWPDTNSATGIVRIVVVAIDPVAQTVTFKINTTPPPAENG